MHKYLYVVTNDQDEVVFQVKADNSLGLGRHTSFYDANDVWIGRIELPEDSTLQMFAL